VIALGIKAYCANLKCAKKDIKIENLNIRSSYIKQVKQYKCLGSIINDTSSIEEEVKEKIALGIKSYYTNLKCAKKDIKIENLNIRSFYIEQVKQYKYLGSILSDTSSI